MRSLAVFVACCVGLPAAGAVPASPVMSGPPQTGIFRGRPVTYERINGRDVFEGDILLDHVQPLPTGKSGLAPQSVGIAYGQYLWPQSGGVANIPYIVTNGSAVLSAAISQFNTTFAGIIQFNTRNGEADYVNFDFDTGSGGNGICESSVGRIGGEQEVTGAANCSLGTTLHELGHVVGLYHEMTRSDRNSFVTFNYQNVIKGSIDNFTQLADDNQNLTLYDYASVMSYVPYAFSRNGGPTLESIPPGIALSNTVGYTAADIDGVKRLYGAAPKTVTVTSNPAGLTVVVDGVNVTTPQTYNWRIGSTHTLAVPAAGQTVTSGGVTYAYTYGRWNDSTAASHSVTVKAGNKTLAQPKTSPAVTVYTANFVGLSAYTAVASPAHGGSVSVAPAPLSYTGLSGQYFVARQVVSLTPSPSVGYNFLQWAGGDWLYVSNYNTSWGANPKSANVPDLGAPMAVVADMTTKPITTITTTPPGLGFQVDNNGFYYGPANFNADDYTGWTPNSKHSIAAWTPEQPFSVNTRFNFVSWTPHGAISHTIKVPSGASTITADFTAQYVPIAYAQPDCAAGVAITPASPDGFYTAGKVVKLKPTVASGWTLTGWLYDASGRRSAQSLSVTDEELAVANYDTSVTPLAVTSLKPAMMAAGSAGGTVAILGTGFTTSSIVFVNNVYRQSTYVSAKQITVPLTAADVASAGAFQVGVSNFPPDAPCSAYAAQAFFVTE